MWLEREPAPPSYVFFGFDTDTALASYLFAVIDRAIRSELEGFRSRRPELAGTRLRQASGNFQIGMAGTALMILRHQVVEDAFRVTAPKLRTMTGLTFRRNQAFQAGRDAGERVNLRRPVTRDGHAQLEG